MSLAQGRNANEPVLFPRLISFLALSSPGVTRFFSPYYIQRRRRRNSYSEIFFYGGEKKFLFFGWSEENEKKMKTNEKTPSRRGRERERERHSISMIRRNVSNMMACTIEKRSTKTLETTAAEIVRIISQPARDCIHRDSNGRTDRRNESITDILSLSLSYWPRVIMSCLLGDLPARLVFLFFYYFFSVLFGGRPSLRFLAQLSGI